jgi:hypothetical protein
VILDELASFLLDAEVVEAGHLFKGVMPDDPDTVIALFESPGLEPEYVHDAEGPLIERPRLQVQSRAQTYEAARLAAELVHAALARITNQNIGGVRYLAVTALQSPFSLGYDINRRALIVCNYQVFKEPS